MLGGRIMFAHLLAVAVIVLVLRWTLRESAEWAAARQAADADHERIHFSRIGQLFRPPVVFAVVATGLYYATWNLGASTLGSFGTYLWTTLTGRACTSPLWTSCARRCHEDSRTTSR
jgi:inositol transporter-like SP family MFS transporter